MPKPSHDQSIENEPHLLRSIPPASDADESSGTKEDLPREDVQVEHGIWDEPGLSPGLAGEVPDDAVTYSRWLEKRIEETGTVHSMLITCLIALCSGPFAIYGAFANAGGGTVAFFATTVFGPLVEEIMKVAAILWVVEKRPYLFQSRFQIGLCAMMSGLAFASIENLLYLHVYIDDPSALIIVWRWTICTMLHIGCTLIASMGLMRIWKKCIDELQPPELSVGAVYPVIAIVVHGSYNAFVTVLSLLDFQF